MTDTLISDWVDAISILGSAVTKREAGLLISNVSMRWASTTETGIHIANLTYKAAEGFTGRPRRIVLLINPRIEKLYHIERVEAMLYAAIECWRYLAHAGDSAANGLYNALGVYNISLLNPKVRWHHLGMKYHLSQVAASKFESRPVCPICHIHVCTGHTNPKLHDGCAEYIRNVYVPALRAQKRAEREVMK